MKLDKAIELGKEAVQSLKQGKFHDHADAVHLLIEAAKVIKSIRPYSNTNKSYYLPGETKAD